MNNIEYKSKNSYNNLFADMAIRQGYTEKETYDLIKKLDALNFHIMIDTSYTPVFIYDNENEGVVHKLQYDNTIQDAFEFMNNTLWF